MKEILLFLLCCVLFSASFAQQSDTNSNGMKTYYLVFLKTGPNRSQDSITAARIQEGHMAHLNKMANEGKMCLAGPFMDDGDIRGICVYNVNSAEETKTLAEEDPAVKSGRLIVEIHPWYSMKGATLK